MHHLCQFSTGARYKVYNLALEIECTCSVDGIMVMSIIKCKFLQHASHTLS